MIDPAIISAAASVVSAIAASVAAVGIWHGIRAMVHANKDRAGILDQQRDADERRHDEVMQAGDRRHAEAPRRRRPFAHGPGLSRAHAARTAHAGAHAAAPAPAAGFNSR